MNARQAVMIGGLALILSGASLAMTGVEFLKVEDASEQAKIVKPIVVTFVSRGYKNVPSWASLSSKMADLIRKNGYRYKSVEDIAEEAALELGMTR